MLPTKYAGKRSILSIVILLAELAAFSLLVKQQLIPSEKYGLYQNLKPEELLHKAWEQDAQGINRVIDVYALGKKPIYPAAIDSIGFDVANKQYLVLLGY